MKRPLTILTVVGVVAFSMSAWGAYNIDDFDFRAPGPLNGQGPWSSSGVTVTNTPTYAASLLAAALSQSSAASNAVDVTPAIAWTEFRIRAALGDENPPRTNGASLSLYFHADGYVRVWTNTAWHVCSKNIWGGDAPELSSAAWAEIAIYQDFSASNAVLFVNDVIVAQDIPFPDSPAGGKYNRFVVRNSNDSSATLETVWIQSTNDTTRHSADSNGVFGVDAEEVDMYGYAARTLGVGGGSGYPQFASIQDAVDSQRANDTLYIATGTYTQDLVVTKDLAFGGQSFTLIGDITVTAGSTLALVAGADLTLTGTISVAGTVTVDSSSRLGSTDLNIISNGQVVSSGGTLNDTGIPVDMTGVFTIGSEWDTEATSSLNFSEDWELFAGDQRVINLGFRGWGASAARVLVKTGEGVTNSKACILPRGEKVYNRVSSVATQIWTDCYIRPYLGMEPDNAPVSTSAFVAYANSNGYLVVATGGSWIICSNNFVNAPAIKLGTNVMRRVTIHKDFTKKQFAVFVEGDLMLEQQPFPGQAVTTYSKFLADSPYSKAYLDNIEITTLIPSGSSDLDHDSVPDMQEIGTHGTIGVDDPGGTVLIFK